MAMPPAAAEIFTLPLSDEMLDEGRFIPAAALSETPPSLDGPCAAMTGAPTPLAATMAPSAVKLTEPPLLVTLPMAMLASAVRSPLTRVVVTSMSPPVVRLVKVMEPI